MIIRNAIKCKICGDIIESFGGHEYLRRSAKSFDDIIELSEIIKVNSSN